MTRRCRLLGGALALFAVACSGNPQQLAVRVGRCNAVQSGNRFTVIAQVENDSTKPISSMDLTADFYQQFQYTTYGATARLGKELDPGQKRDVTFLVASSNAMHGEAMRCVVTRIGYLDGTSESIRPER
jgi:hypothetical protein